MGSNRIPGTRLVWNNRHGHRRLHCSVCSETRERMLEFEGELYCTIHARAVAGQPIMPTRTVRLPGELTGLQPPVDVGHVHWCSEICEHITPVTRRAVELLCQGKTNSQIAQAMRLNPSLVGQRLRRLARRLGVRSRTELAVLAISSGVTRGNSALTS